MSDKTKSTAMRVLGRATANVITAPLAYQFTMFKLHPTRKRLRKIVNMMDQYINLVHSIDPGCDTEMQIRDMVYDLNKIASAH